MVSGTLYTLMASPRSSWLPALAKYCGHDIKSVEKSDAPEMESIFPLGKTPSFISDDGEKVTEFVAVVQYFIANATVNKDFGGANTKEQIQELRWLAYFNSDVIETMVKVAFGPNDEEKAKGKAMFEKNMNYVDATLAESKHTYLVSDKIVAADIHAYTVLKFSGRCGLDISAYKNISKYLDLVKDHELCQA